MLTTSRFALGAALAGLVLTATYCSSESPLAPAIGNTSPTPNGGMDSSSSAMMEGGGTTADANSTPPPVVACAGDPDLDASASDATTIEGGAGACNMISCGPVVAAQNTTIGMPDPKGGVIQPGTYALTSVSVYTGSNGVSGPAGFLVQESFRFDATTYDQVYSSTKDVDAALSPALRVSGTYTVSGATLESTPTCGGVSTVSYITYTALGSTLIEYSGNQAFIYTRQ